jgi:hypothetical protein
VRHNDASNYSLVCPLSHKIISARRVVILFLSARSDVIMMYAIKGLIIEERLATQRTYIILGEHDIITSDYE